MFYFVSFSKQIFSLNIFITRICTYLYNIQIFNKSITIFRKKEYRIDISYFVLDCACTIIKGQETKILYKFETDTVKIKIKE